MLSQLIGQFKTLLPWLLAIVMIVTVLGAILLAVHFGTDINVRYFVSDPAETALLPEYAGSYSSLGVIVLWTAAVISVMTGLIVRGLTTGGPSSFFFLSFGALIGWLALDDLFMWHEWLGLMLARMVGAENIADTRSQLEAIVFMVYGVAWLTWLVRFWSVIRGTEYLLLGIALAGFAVSMGIDLGTYVVPELEPETQRMETTLAVLEELLKLVGIFFMMAYSVRITVPAIRQAIGRTAAS